MTTTTHTLDQATDAARTALTACWFTGGRNSGIRDGRVAGIAPDGRRIVVLMTPAGWQVQGGDWRVLTEVEAATYRTRLHIGGGGSPIPYPIGPVGAVGAAWMSVGI